MKKSLLHKLLPVLTILAIPLLAADCDKKDISPSLSQKDPEIEWKLIFEEEFEGSQTNPKYWASYQPQTSSSAWNKYVNPKDTSLAEVKDGNLYLRAKWNSDTDLPETGAIQTKDKFSFKYGKLEVKAKFTRMGQGSWPAIWMMPQNPVFQNWPDGGEIDVMEHLNRQTNVFQVMHQSASEGVELKPSRSVTPTVDLNDYNTYGIVKTPEKIEFYVNDQKTMTYSKGGGNAVRWPFETDFYLILNHASADKGQSGTYYWPGLVSSTEDFPYEMAVDYVKVWEIVE